MKRIIIDSDGLIKLNKAGILVKLLSLYKCIIPEEVYEEAVLKGKKESVLKLLSSGRISLSYACELLDRSPYYIYELAKEHGIELGAEEFSFEKAQETLSDTL